MYDEFNNNNLNENSTDSVNHTSVSENSSTGNFSNDPSITGKISVGYNSQSETTYYAESKPDAANPQTNGYSTKYYQAPYGTQANSTQHPQPSVRPQPSSQANPSPYGPQTTAPGVHYSSVQPNPNATYNGNAKNVKKLTNNHMSGFAKGLIAAGICLSLIFGIAAGSLISSYVYTHNNSIVANSQETLSSGNDSSSSKGDTSETNPSDFLTYAIEDKDTSPLSTAEIAAKCGPSVVEIRTEMVIYGRWMQEYVTEGAGSGVILTEDGYIVTNNHVIEGASKITVTLQDGTTYEATLIGTDEKADIALIKVEANGLTPATLGDSDTLVVGEKAVAIGNPLGELGGTVTDGIISALDREITIDGVKMTLLQTNAAINPGNSGGGLFDGAGNLIAIVDAKSSGEGIEGLGFAIPVNDMATVVDQLMNYGYVRGYTDTGMTFIDITDMLTAMQYRVNNLGVYVLKVSGEKALEAGFQSGDLITMVDGQEISSSADIDSIISQHSVGDQIEFEIYRSRGTLTLTLTLDEYVPDNTNA